MSFQQLIDLALLFPEKQHNSTEKVLLAGSYAGASPSVRVEDRANAMRGLFQLAGQDEVFRSHLEQK